MRIEQRYTYNNGYRVLEYHYASEGKQFWFLPDTVVSNIIRIQPRRGPKDGNTKVLVLGDNFLDTDEVWCKFGETIVYGVWVNTTHMYCYTPSHSAGRFNVRVTFFPTNQSHWTTDEIFFT